MTRLASTLFGSLDGVAEVDPAWQFSYFEQDMGRAGTEDYALADALLLRRITYESLKS